MLFFGKKFLYQTEISQFFFLSVCGLLFPWSSFQEMFLILMKSSPSISAFMDHAYGGMSKNSFVTRVVKVFSYVFLFKNFAV